MQCLVCYGSWCLVIYKIHGVLVMERNDQVNLNHKKTWPMATLARLL